VFGPRAQCDPNTIATRNEKLARTLDPRIDGKYTKRMVIANKDIHFDPNLARDAFAE